MMKRILLILTGLIIAVAIIFPLYIYHALGQSVGSSDRPLAFNIESGESTTQIMNRLYDQKLIKNKLAFVIYIRLKHKTLKSGEFDLAENYSLKTVIDTLDGGILKFHKMTIPEGWRTEQIAQRLDARGITKYDDFMAAAAGQEGYLFPDTYEFKLDVTASEIVSKMRANFDHRTEGLSVSNDNLILASIIERESENDADRPGIAAVFDNRVKIAMKLQSDVTVVYQKDNNDYPSVGILNYLFWQKLYSGDITATKGSYNTYLNNGLPPTPICNPGLPSIQATISPAKHSYLFFLYGKDHTIHYANTQAEQDANANKYLY